jgi:hypothetical protein
MLLGPSEPHIIKYTINSPQFQVQIHSRSNSHSSSSYRWGGVSCLPSRRNPRLSIEKWKIQPSTRTDLLRLRPSPVTVSPRKYARSGMFPSGLFTIRRTLLWRYRALSRWSPCCVAVAATFNSQSTPAPSMIPGPSRTPIRICIRGFSATLAQGQPQQPPHWLPARRSGLEPGRATSKRQFLLRLRTFTGYSSFAHALFTFGGYPIVRKVMSTSPQPKKSDDRRWLR